MKKKIHPDFWRLARFSRRHGYGFLDPPKTPFDHAGPSAMDAFREIDTHGRPVASCRHPRLLRRVLHGKVLVNSFVTQSKKMPYGIDALLDAYGDILPEWAIKVLQASWHRFKTTDWSP